MHFFIYLHREGPLSRLSRIMPGHTSRANPRRSSVSSRRWRPRGFRAAGGYRLYIHFAPTDELYVTQSAFLLTEVATMLGYVPRIAYGESTWGYAIRHGKSAQRTESTLLLY